MKSAQYHLTEMRAFYGMNLALEVEELTIASGRLHVLAGPNGSDGKVERIVEGIGKESYRTVDGYRYAKL
jgi:Fe-S cluster assembly ATPase SufC